MFWFYNLRHLPLSSFYRDEFMLACPAWKSAIFENFWFWLWIFLLNGSNWSPWHVLYDATKKIKIRSLLGLMGLTRCERKSSGLRPDFETKIFLVELDQFEWNVTWTFQGPELSNCRQKKFHRTTYFCVVLTLVGSCQKFNLHGNRHKWVSNDFKFHIGREKQLLNWKFSD